MSDERIELTPQFREYQVRRVDEKLRRIELSFSSEEPFERWWGIEVLDHDRDSIRLARLKRAGVGLFNHKTDVVVGTLADVRIESRRGTATLQFFDDEDQDAERVFRKVKGGLRNVSVGYRVYAMVLEEQSSDGPDIYRITDWEPFEISIVSVPADVSVGVGRSAEDLAPNPVTVRGADTMQLNRLAVATRAAFAPNDGNGGGDSAASAEGASRRQSAAMRQGAEGERERIRQLRDIARAYPGHDEVENVIERCEEDGTDLQAAQQMVLEALGKRTFEPREILSSDIPGVGRREQKRFDLLRLVRALAVAAQPGFVDARTAKRWQKEAGHELELCVAFSQRVGRDPREEASVVVPTDLLYGKHQRLLDVATEGTDVVATEIGDPVDALRAASKVVEAGAILLPGLVGNVQIPRQTGVGAITWVAESGSAGDTTPTFDNVTLTPHTMAARTDLSRRMMLQSSFGMSEFVQNDLRRGMTVELDRVAIEGNPDVTATANEPRGIIYQSGIGSVALGTHGAAPTRANLVDLITEIAQDNALMGTPQFLMNSLTIGFFMKLLVDAGSGQFVMMKRDEAVGFPVQESNNVPGDLTKGVGTNLNAILAGDFSQAVIGLWSGQDLLVDPYTQGASGALRLVAFQDVDVVLRRVQSFSAILDAVIS